MVKIGKIRPVLVQSRPNLTLLNTSLLLPQVYPKIGTTYMDIQIAAYKFYDYSKYIRGYSPKTVKRYSQAINHYCKQSAAVKFSDITNENVREFFFYGRIERKWAIRTYIVVYMSLIVFFRWAIDQGYMTFNPVDGIEKPKLDKRIPVKLNQKDTLYLLEVVYNYPYYYRYPGFYKFLQCRNHAIFAMFIFAGIRLNELLNLNVTDVDIENMTIFIQKGKGNKDRIIPMSSTLAQSLKRYMVERNKMNKTCPKFFVSLIKNIGYTESGLKRLVATIKKASGLKFSIHKLRHTFATLMLEGGCDIYSLSRMMGHSDIKTTTIYLSASAEHLRNQMVKHPLN